MKARLLLCLCLLLTTTSVFAQKPLTVSGIVTEEATGEPAIGVNIVVKGTTNGTMSSIDGD